MQLMHKFYATKYVTILGELLIVTWPVKIDHVNAKILPIFSVFVVL